jgi:hypothetical protein
MAALHFHSQAVIDLLGDGNFQTSVQGFALNCLFQALPIGADIRTTAIELTAKVQLHSAIGTPHHTDHFLLGSALTAAHTLPHRYSFLHKLPPVLYYSSSDWEAGLMSTL